MLSQLFPPQFPHCGDDPVPVPWTGWGPSGGRCHLGMAAPADTPRGSCSHQTEPCPGLVFGSQVGSLCRGAPGGFNEALDDGLGGRELSAPAWGQQGWLASLPPQGWRAKVTNGETEARLVHGVALIAAGAGSRAGRFASCGPSRCLGGISGGLWGSRVARA